MDFGAYHVSFNSSRGTVHDILQWYQCSPVFFMFLMSETFNTVLGLFTNIWVQVLILGDWRKQAVQEIFTINLGMLEIIYCFLSQVLMLNYIALKITSINKYIWFVYGFCFFGRSLFQCGMCVERYIAVVHPMFYFRHRFLKCKVIFLILGWLITAIFIWYSINNSVMTLIEGMFIFVMSVDLFCSLSILMVLKRPSPGAGGGKKVKKMSLKKKRACYTVMIIQATVILNYVPHFIVPTLKLYMTPYNFSCMYQPLGIACCLMGSFLQPLIFLHHAGKLQGPGHKESPQK